MAQSFRDTAWFDQQSLPGTGTGTGTLPVWVQRRSALPAGGIDWRSPNSSIAEQVRQ